MLDIDKVESVIRPFIEKSGLSLYDIEFLGRILRVSIEKPGGVSLEDCVETSRLLNPLLDVEDLVPGGKYELEVWQEWLGKHREPVEIKEGEQPVKITLNKE